jgi:hypothetical protein
MISRISVLLLILLISPLVDTSADFPLDSGRKDNSALDIAAGTQIAYLVADPMGRQSGFDASGNQIKEIQGSAAYKQFSFNEGTGEGATDGTETVNITQPSRGAYQIHITGNRTGKYSLYISIFSTDGSAQPVMILKGNIQKAHMTTAQLMMDPAPGSVPTIKGDSTMTVQTRPIQTPKPVLGPRH